MGRVQTGQYLWWKRLQGKLFPGNGREFRAPIPVSSHSCGFSLCPNFCFLFSAVFHWQATIMGPVSKCCTTLVAPFGFESILMLKFVTVVVFLAAFDIWIDGVKLWTGGVGSFSMLNLSLLSGWQSVSGRSFFLGNSFPNRLSLQTTQGKPSRSWNKVDQVGPRIIILFIINVSVIFLNSKKTKKKHLFNRQSKTDKILISRISLH